MALRSSAPLARARAVLFDLDGTLVHSSPDIAASLNEGLLRAGLAPFTATEVEGMVGHGAAVLVQRAFAARGAPEPPGALAAFKAHYDAHCLDSTHPYPGIPELLRHLASTSRRCAVVTNKPTAFAEKLVSSLGLGALFAAVIGPERAEAPKPAPEHVRAALSALGVAPGDAVMVGDGPTDVLAGVRAGCHSVAALWGYQPRAELEGCAPEYLVQSPQELADLLG